MKNMRQNKINQSRIALLFGCKLRTEKRQTKRACPPKKRGFTLLEVIVALFVFSLAMVAVSGIFASFMRANKAVKTTQKGLEDAQQAINIMTKVIRTSSVVTSSASTLRIFEYSADGDPACRQYVFSGTRITYATDSGGTPAPDIATCVGAPMSTPVNVVESQISGAFIVTPSASGSAGKVTMLMTVTGEGSIQSTVSLRDYAVSG
jgi:prepilin-type N-terminal cleavage/methylation domain-containing protein